MAQLTIGKLAKATDVKTPTIRFYEQIGLLPAPERTDSDRRVYGDDAVRRLAFIKHARQLGFPVDSIRNLLDLAGHPERPCAEANALAQDQLTAVEAKIAQLQTLRDELKRMVDAGCGVGSIGECRVIESLSDHGLCAHEHAAPERMVPV